MRRANGTGSIYKGNGIRRKPYIVKAAAIKVGDKFVRRTLGSFKTLKEAQEMLNNYVKNKFMYENTEITLGELFEEWKISNHAKNIKTQQVYQSYVNSFSTTFSTLLNKSFVQLKYVNYQPLLDVVAKKTSKDCITILRNIYSTSIKKELISTDISSLLEPSKIITKKVNRTVFNDEFVLFLWKRYNETFSENYAMILILFYTGMRTADLIRLKNKNIFLEKKYFITGSKTKSGLNRQIPIHELIYPIFNKFININEFLFNIKSNGFLISKFKCILNEYGIEGNLHSIRHTFITKMQKLKIKVSIIKKIVGHKDNSITDGIYTHWSIEDLLKEINKLKY